METNTNTEAEAKAKPKTNAKTKPNTMCFLPSSSHVVLYCVEIVGRTAIGVARGAFHLGLMMMIMIIDEADNDETDDDEYRVGHGQWRPSTLD